MRRLLLPVLLCSALNMAAQDFLGYSHSNYAGIVGASYNPASLADHRYSLDILLAGLSVEGGNNYVGVKRADIWRSDFGTQYLHLREWNTKKAVFFRNEILLPGVMFSNAKYGWGVDMKVRTYANVEGIEHKLAHLMVMGFDDPGIFGQELHNRHVGINMLSWFELGGTYAKTLYSGAEHFLSVGVRPKFLLGLAAASVFLNDADYTFYNDSTLALYSGDLRLTHSDNFSFGQGFQPSYRLGFNPGIGLDAGLVYEHRPDELQNESKEKKKPWPGFRERPEYSYRIGISLTDLGIIHFKSGQLSDHYTVSANAWDIDDATFDSTSPPPLYATFKEEQRGTNSGNAFWMRLPLALNLQYDYRIRKDIFVNAASFTGLYLRNNNGNKVHELTRFTVAPRWETRWLGVWAPVSFSRLGNPTLGTGVRLGPLVVGTNDILLWMLKNKTNYSADLYFVLKVPLFPLPGHKGKGKSKKASTTDIDKCPD